MKKKIYLIMITIVVVGCVAAAYKFMQHEYRQNEKISQLNAQIKLLATEFENKDLNIDFSEDSYNYLAIGNSITLHEICDYWWNECGMAASEETEDYFHKLCKKLKDEYGEVSAYAYNFSVWEIMASDRAETLEVLKPYLNPNLDLITVQLGENVSNLDEFENDFKFLLEYISENVPDCEVIVIGDFWEKANRDSVKEDVCLRGGWRYVSLNEIKDSPEYECGVNTTVYDENGNEHVVVHSGVAAHPNDKGMSYIADAVFGVLKEEEKNVGN